MLFRLSGGGGRRMTETFFGKLSLNIVDLFRKLLWSPPYIGHPTVEGGLLYNRNILLLRTTSRWPASLNTSWLEGFPRLRLRFNWCQPTGYAEKSNQTLNLAGTVKRARPADNAALVLSPVLCSAPVLWRDTPAPSPPHGETTD